MCNDYILRDIKLLRGTFTASPYEKIGIWLFMIVFGVAGPALFASALFAKGIPRFPLDFYQYFAVLMILTGPIIAVLSYIRLGRSYEFTEQTVIERNRVGRKLCTLSMEEIEKVTIKDSWLILNTSNKQIKFHMMKQLRIELKGIATRRQSGSDSKGRSERG